MVSWNPFRRRHRTIADTSADPIEVDDVFYSGSTPVSQAGLFATAGRAWSGRLGMVVGMAKRAAAWTVGVETRGRKVERRAITSVPWNQGGDSPGFTSEMTVDRALHLTPVFAAGRMLASNVASMPLQQYRKNADDTRQKLPLTSLFVQPSVQGTLHDWLFRAVTSLAYRGNAIGYITQRDYYENPTMIEWLNPDHVQVIDSIPYLGQPGSYTNPIWYYLGRIVPAEDLLHIPWFTLPGKVWGLSPIGAFASTVSTGLAAQQFSEEWFTTGGVPPGTFQNASQTVNQTDADKIKDRLVAAIQSRKPIVYGKDWTYTPITVSAAEAKFVDTMRLGATQIASIYGIPPELIGGETGGSMSYSSPEQRQIEFVQFALLPWIRKLEDAFTTLIPRGQYVKFNVDSLIRVDAAVRFKNYELSRLIGLNNLDELRALEDQPPLPNGAGQDYTPLPLAAGQTIHVPAIRGEPGKPRLVEDDWKDAENG